jgi:hypothetical protein
VAAQGRLRLGAIQDLSEVDRTSADVHGLRAAHERISTQLETITELLPPTTILTP